MLRKELFFFFPSALTCKGEISSLVGVLGIDRRRSRSGWLRLKKCYMSTVSSPP